MNTYNRDLFWGQPMFANKTRFHYKDGLWFIRDLQPWGNGNVTIMKINEQEEKNGGTGTGVFEVTVEYEVTIDLNSFASIVASMCKSGETGTNYQTIYDLLIPN